MGDGRRWTPFRRKNLPRGFWDFPENLPASQQPLSGPVDEELARRFLRALNSEYVEQQEGADPRELGGGNSNIFYVHPYLGKMNPIWRAYFFKWVGSTTNQLNLSMVPWGWSMERLYVSPLLESMEIPWNWGGMFLMGSYLCRVDDAHEPSHG